MNPAHEARKYIAISIKHSRDSHKQYNGRMTLWGHRTKDGEERSFGGYTVDPAECELYSLQDWEKTGYYGAPWMFVSSSVPMCIDLCKKYKRYDTVLVHIHEYMSYYKLLGLERSQMTNYELIKNMTVEEMAVTIMCPNELGMAEIPCDHGDDKNCCKCCLDWLQAESERVPDTD